MKRILITGAGGSPAANFIRSLRKLKENIFIVGTDSSEYYINRSEANISYLAPSCRDPKYTDFLNYIIKKHSLEFLHVQNDSEVEAISRLREKLNIHLFMPSKETVEICLDKYKSYEVWQKHNITVPKTYPIDTPAELEKVYKQLKGKVWIRNKSGAGGRGSLAPKNLQQAKAWIDFQEGWGGAYVAADLLTPDSITWMSIWKDGELIVAQGRKRLYWELSKISPSGITGATGGGITVRDPQVDEIAIRSIYAIDSKPNGIFSVDLTYDFKGIPNPTEINIARFFTTHLFFTEAGLNMPEIYIKLAYHEKLPKLKRKINPLSAGWVWIRGMDFNPVLIKKSKIEKDKKQLTNILEKI